MGVCEYGPDVLFVHQGNVFFGLAECCVGECLEDIETGFCLSVYVVVVWDERHVFVLYRSECGGRVGVRNKQTKQTKILYCDLKKQIIYSLQTKNNNLT